MDTEEKTEDTIDTPDDKAEGKWERVSKGRGIHSLDFGVNHNRYEKPLSGVEKYNNYKINNYGSEGLYRNRSSNSNSSNRESHTSSYIKPYRPSLNLNFLSNNYKKLPVVTNVRGFVVNIKGAMNFDIDLDLSSIPEKDRAPYMRVCKKMYEYVDYDKDTLKESTIRKSFAYRTHLRGLDLKDKSNINSKQRDYANTEIERLILENNRWITANLFDIDIYSRLLIDIIITTDNGTIDIATQLLHNHPTLFTEYNSGNYNKSKPVYYG